MMFRMFLKKLFSGVYPVTIKELNENPEGYWGKLVEVSGNRLSYIGKETVFSGTYDFPSDYDVMLYTLSNEQGDIIVVFKEGKDRNIKTDNPPPFTFEGEWGKSVKGWFCLYIR